jgi:Na+/proline symporter
VAALAPSVVLTTACLALAMSVGGPSTVVDLVSLVIGSAAAVPIRFVILRSLLSHRPVPRSALRPR